MNALPDDVVHFLQRQHFVVVSTIDKDGNPHCACKGIVKIDKNGMVYLLDLYVGETHKNLEQNPHITIAAVDEHRFIGYCLKGKGRISNIKSGILKEWSNKIVSRISHRIVQRMHGERGHPRHPEILMPKPKYMIVMDVEDIIDMTPGHLK